uniref:Uncharacterized protein n=1 Tax=Anguilla anguilla TaxID=7936 RepID=A0A0E9PBV6_ANGAN
MDQGYMKCTGTVFNMLQVYSTFRETERAGGWGKAQWILH